MSLYKSVVSALCLAIALAPAIASAADFDDAAAGVWTARTNAFLHAGETATDPSDMVHEFGVACKGLTGDLTKYGAHTPMWAQQAHSVFCSGINVFHMNQRSACKTFKDARKQFAKADPAKDPAEVVTSAQNMTTLLDTIIGGGREHHVC